MRRFLTGIAFLALLPLAAQAAPDFPALKGRVVDNAGLLSPQARRSLSGTLADFEKQTGNQIVVLTIDSTNGTPIEDYGYQLGRHWGIGQKGQDNGAILIVAAKDRKVRIEVGYGLEGVLTDATTYNIIQSRILPEFRHGSYEAGILGGVQAMIQAIGGKYKPGATASSHRKKSAGVFALFFPFMLIIALIAILNGIRGGRRWHRHGYWGGGYWGGGFGGGSGGGSFGGGSFGGGGFSGGGGSFGGGGASGGW